MHSVDEYFSVFNADERLLDTALAHTHGLYFRTVQGNAALIGLINEKIMICFLLFAISFWDSFPFAMATSSKPCNYSEPHCRTLLRNLFLTALNSYSLLYFPYLSMN